MSWIDAAGISLSVLAVLLLVWMISDARRLAGVEGPTVGAGSAARLVWPAILVSSFLGGLFGVRKEERSARGVWQVEARDASLQLPWIFLLACLAYLVSRRRRTRSRDGFSRATRTGGRLSTG
jgi:hypothetical protein